MSTALYFSPQPTRSRRAHWAFLEAEADFVPHEVDIFAGEQNEPAYRALNPMGHVPTATFDSQAVSESAALALIVCSEAKDLVPPSGTAAWRAALQWVIFAPAELDPQLATLNAHRLLRPLAERIASVAAQAEEAWIQRAQRLEATLTGQPFLLGESFGVADICVGHSVVWAKMHDLLPAGSVLQTYLDKLQARPAFQKVYGGPIEVYPDPHAG
ncbi:MAG: glutathione S-transferase family protein [Nannocystaceae bacterium]|nr:glutathione S-transferase family protein [Nannocystaceae bacterium]